MIECDVCHNRCRLDKGKTGACKSRINEDDRMVLLNYGMITGLALDPIEKKPLNRFFPGSYILSVGSFGCNLKCAFCQNHDISQAGSEITGPDNRLDPEELKDMAVRISSEDPRGNIGVAYTYNEPLIGWEFVYDTSVLIHKAGLKNVVVTNGCINKKIEDKILPHIDAMNIDLKCFTAEGYRKLGGDLDTVLDFIETAHDKSHIELTTLVVPGFNDDEELFLKECEFIASLDPKIPLHISRFFPRYKMTDKRPTDETLMRSFYDIAKNKLEYVYLGNM